MRVAAGLDSLVLGEGQILSQVKKMMRLGQEHKSLGPILNRLLTQAVSTGKKVRSETNLGTGAVSISSAAVELAQLKLGQSRGLDQLVTLESEQIAVVGAWAHESPAAAASASERSLRGGVAQPHGATG